MNEADRQAFGAFLRRIREEAQLSLREAEKRLGISNSYLYQIEKGERGAPKLEVLRKMAIEYNVPYESILAAAHLDDPVESRAFNEHLEDELERAFEYVRKDKRFKFGTHMNGSELTPEAKRFIVEMYQKLARRKLLGDKEEP
jgi:transcriptional regulator with XRE-family HTH domain